MGRKRKKAASQPSQAAGTGPQNPFEDEFVLHPDGVEEVTPNEDDSVYQSVYSAPRQGKKRRRKRKKKAGDEDGEGGNEDEENRDDIGEEGNDRNVWAEAEQLGWKASEINPNVLWSMEENNLAGLITLEEVDGSEYSEFVSGGSSSSGSSSSSSSSSSVTQKKKKKPKKEQGKKDSSSSPGEEEEDTTTKAKKKTKKKKKKNKGKDKKGKATQNKDEKHAFDPTKKLPASAWDQYKLHPSILQGIHALGFTSPTPIQAECLPAAVRDWKDIIGSACTGSGKTLAFGIPAVQRALEDLKRNKHKDNDNSNNIKNNRRPMSSLILCPTRELALQVCKHIQNVARYTPVKAVAIVGGISEQKQDRLLSKRPHIVVGTPGRVWKLVTEGNEHLCDVSGLRCFILDEADRMVEGGHFPELTSLVHYLHAFRNKAQQAQQAQKQQAPKKKKHKKSMQILLFSATVNLSEQGRERSSGKRSRYKQETSVLDDLIEKLGFSEEPHFADLTTETQTASTLEEFKIDCVAEEKDLYAYYFLLNNPGTKTLVFVNSISCLRRLVSILKLLGVAACPLHAQLQQRQRLKNLDRFKSADSAVIVCTDVAARGLDIPSVDNVLHYQLPRSSEVYIHRSGRAARAGRNGLSFALVDASDQRAYATLCSVLERPDGLEDYPVDRSLLPLARDRVGIARKIDIKVNAKRQRKSKNDWFRQNAEAMDMILDDNLVDEGDEDENRKRDQEVKKLKGQLNILLAAKNVSNTLSRNFFTRHSVA